MSHDQDSARRSMPVRYWDLQAALLLLAALAAVAARLAATQWTDDLNLILYVTLLGAAAGLALGQSRFPAGQATVFGLVYGLFVVPWQLGRTLGDDLMWPQRLTSLGNRMGNAVAQLANRQAVRDPLFFLLLMAGLFWILSAHAGYSVTRRNQAWRAAIPAGVTLVVIQAYDSLVASRAWFLAFYLFLTLLLVARLAYLRQRTRWQQNRTSLPEFLGVDVARFILLVASVLVLLAWGIPSLAAALPPAAQAWQAATEPWWTDVRDRVGNAFASVRGARPVTGYTGYYGETLPLGYGREIPETLFMTVEVPAPTRIPRYYWRARIYDQYSEGQWTSTLTSTQIVTPTGVDLALPDADLEVRSSAFFTFTPAVPLLTLYTAPQPLWVSHPAEAGLAYNSDGTVDLGTLTAVPPLEPEEAYRAQSSLSTATVAQLRAAGTDYPEWVTSRYVHLPPSITPRTHELARQIALDQDNPYDIAAAITDYLRTEIAYADTIPSPPRDQEPLDWFLFDQREGFCNYYASAEVILLRSLGIPARLAAGFAQGERHQGTYLVLHSNSHAWPEVYFPDLGWIEFEPTASERPLQRPLGDTQAYTDTAAGPTGPSAEDRLPEAMEDDSLGESSPVQVTAVRTRTVVCASLVTVALILMLLAWRKRRSGDLPSLPILLVAGLRRLGLEPPPLFRSWARRSSLPPLERAYLEINRALTRLDAPPDRAATPAERAAALTRLLPAASGSVRVLLKEYHATAYSPQSGDQDNARGAAHTIRVLSRRALIHRPLRRRIKPNSARVDHRERRHEAAITPEIPKPTESDSQSNP